MRAAAACVLTAAGCLLTAGGVAAHARSGAAAQGTAAATAAALEQSGLSHRKASDAVWVVSLKSASSTPIDVIINAQNELVVVFAVVARTPTLSESQLRDLLRASYSANFAKLAIDDDGDLLALSEIAAKSVTAALLRTAVEEVANAGDAAARLVRAGHAAAPEERIETVAAGRGATLPLVRGAFELSYDPAKWTPNRATQPNVTELVHVSGDAYLRVITERVEVASDQLAEAALVNARTASRDVRVVSESWRVVNGLRTLVLRLDGMTNGARFSYYNQMYSDPAGTVYLTGWTGANLFDRYRRDFLELFAGLRKIATR